MSASRSRLAEYLSCLIQVTLSAKLPVNDFRGAINVGRSREVQLGALKNRNNRA